MAKEYQLVTTLPGMTMQLVKRVADNAFIPFDPGNRDYQEYLQWLDQGNEPDPPVAAIQTEAIIPPTNPPTTDLSPEQELAQKDNK